jgi:hypothetical protein
MLSLTILTGLDAISPREHDYVEQSTIRRSDRGGSGKVRSFLGDQADFGFSTNTFFCV